MAVPKSRRTKSNRDNRRMHIYLESKNLKACPNCGAKKMPHRVCLECGFYKGKKVLEIEKEKGKKEKPDEQRSGIIKGGPLDFRKLSQKQ